MTEDPPPNTDTASSADRDCCGTRQGQVAVDELLRLLASPRRRCLLSYLTARGDSPVSTEDLVDAVAEREQPDPGPATHRERIVVDLHHVHLPKLADAGVIDYDPVANTVYYEPSDRLKSLLETSIALGEEGN